MERYYNPEGVVLEAIFRQCKKQDSSAYLELVCNELLDSFDEENEKKLTNILEKLRDKGLIKINGDRLSLTDKGIKVLEKKNSDFLFTDPDLIQIIENNSEMQVAYTDVDIGHGCNVMAICGDILNNGYLCLTELLGVGLAIAKIKECVEAFEWVYEKLQKVYQIYKDKYPDRCEYPFYYGDDILLGKVIKRVLEVYKISFEDIKCLKLTNSLKTKVGALGKYAIEHFQCSIDSLQGAPDAINYFVLELSSDKLTSDYEIITCEISTYGEINYFNTLKVIV